MNGFAGRFGVEKTLEESQQKIPLFLEGEVLGEDLFELNKIAFFAAVLEEIDVALDGETDFPNDLR
jgi:hypothetical protein